MGPAPPPPPTTKKRRLSGSLRAFEPATKRGEIGANKVVAMQHIMGAGETAGLMHDALAEVIESVQAGVLTKSGLVAQLEHVQNGASFTSKIVQASAGKLTNKGKDTLGIGGSYVASMVNSRAAAKQRRDAVVSGEAAGVKPGRSALIELTNRLAQPERLGLKEVPGSSLRPKRKSVKSAGGAQKIAARRKGKGTDAQVKRRNVSGPPLPHPPTPPAQQAIGTNALKLKL